MTRIIVALLTGLVVAQVANANAQSVDQYKQACIDAGEVKSSESCKTISRTRAIFSTDFTAICTGAPAADLIWAKRRGYTDLEVTKGEGCKRVHGDYNCTVFKHSSETIWLPDSRCRL